jgi:transcriptional regulator with XRE-family HTH domain
MVLRYNCPHYRWFQNPRPCDTHTRVSRRKSAVKKDAPRPAVLRPLGAQLRRLRLEREWSQEELAERAGLNYKYVGRVELAKADPGADVLVRLARALEITVGELFDTITPGSAAIPRILPHDADAVLSALSALSTAVDRLLTRQPRPALRRAPRRPRSR